MTQGFEYKDRATAIRHMRYIKGSLAVWLRTYDTADPSPKIRDKNGNPSSIKSLGVSKDALRDYHDWVGQEIGRMEEGDGDVTKPWSVLQRSPKTPSIFTARGVECSLGKLASLAGDPWDAVKRFDGNEASQEGHKIADDRRAKDYKKAKEKGHDWGWVKG